MIVFLKKLLANNVSFENYLKIMHLGFKIAYSTGLLKRNYIYNYHYYVKNLVKSGDVVVDIGANLGYYTYIFKNLVGKGGKVHAIEPMKPFFKILSSEFKNVDNVVLYNYALGLENRPITMQVPKTDDYFRTGLASIDENIQKDRHVFTIDMVKGSELLADIPKIDYIKCDIEGYEKIVIPELISIISKHLPIIQIELFGETIKFIGDVLKPLDYKIYNLIEGKLKSYDPTMSNIDLLFVPTDKQDKIKDYLCSSENN